MNTRPRPPLDDIDRQVRDILAGSGRLFTAVDDLGKQDDLFKAGLSSHANVRVMLAIEERFGIEFPERMLSKSTFRSVSSICDAIVELLGEGRLY
jgi:acyl carrier protein